MIRRNDTEKGNFQYLIVGSILFLAFIISLILEIPTGFYHDIAAWRNWTVFIAQNGISNAYDHPEVNYPPFYLYILNIYAHFTGSETAIRTNIFYLKDITFLVELLSLLLLLYVIRKFRLNAYWLLLLLINPAFWYNSQIWAQVDGIHTAFVLIVLLSIMAGNLYIGMVFLVLAFNMKLQTVIFLPLILFIALPAIIEHWKQILPAMILAAILQFIILIPFLHELEKVWHMITGSVDYYPYVSMNAFNLWYLLIKDNPTQVHDTIEFMNLSYKIWGLILFFLSSFIFLLPSLLRTIIAAFKKENLFNKHDLSMVMLTASLIAMGFFYFNTQMHERYMHPVILFSGAYALLTSRWLPHLLFSLGYVLNLEVLMKTFKLGIYESLIFDPIFIAIILLTGIIMASIDLYKFYFKRTELQFIVGHIKKGKVNKLSFAQ